MISQDYLPSPPLRPYIAAYRLRHFVLRNGHKLACKPFPPRPEQCLVFYPRGFEITEFNIQKNKTQRPRSVITGQFTQRVNRYISYPEFLMIEADLKPGALHRLTGLPCKELANSDVDAESFFSHEIKRVNDRLGSASTYPEMIAIIEAFFLQLVQKEKKSPLQVDHALQLFAYSADFYSVDLLSKQACLSPRQLERKVDERIGVGPKTFLRICRFHQSYCMRLKNPALDWLYIAVACGYTDYQHLVKDYKEFAGTTPNHFFSEEKKAPGRVLGLTK